MKDLASRGKTRRLLGKLALTSAAALTLGGSAMLYSSMASASGYPERPVRVIVAFSAGGTTDILARVVADHLSREYGQSFVVENKPGAGGNIGTAHVVNSKPDGYTLIVDSVGPIAINPTLNTLSYDPVTALVPIAQIADVPNVLVANPGVKVRDINDLVAQIKQHPGTFNYSSTGVGTASHLSGYLMGKIQHLDMTHVPYKGADALNDLLAGRVQIMFATIPSVHPLIEAGKLRPLAVTSEKRSRSLPDVPTMQEAGFANFRTGAWFGLFAPTGTPADVVNKLNASVNRIIQLPDVATQMVQQGADPTVTTPVQFAELVRNERDHWRTVLIESGAVEKPGT